MVAHEAEPTVGEILGTLAQSTATLVRQEVRLATTEMGQKASKASHAFATMAAGGGVLLVGLLVLTFALVAGVATWVPIWLSALIVGALLVGVGAVVVNRGRSVVRHLDLVPRQTVKTIKDDHAWIKEQVQ